MNVYKLPFWVLIFSLCVVASAHARLSDSDTLLKGARLVFEQAPKQQNYRLVLSEIKKANGAWRAEQDEQLNALVTRRTFELREGLRLRDARALLNKATRFSGRLKALFACEGADCGSSNAWANHFFGIKQLYGVNLSQSYSAWELINPQAQRVVLVYYLVERGNGDIMLQEDELVLNQAQTGTVPLAAEVLGNQLSLSSRLVVPGFQIGAQGPSLDSTAILALADMLVMNPGWVVYVVGHDSGAGTLDEQILRGTAYAQIVADRLVDAGIDRSRFIVKSVGGLAPLESESSVRVELVLPAGE